MDGTTLLFIYLVSAGIGILISYLIIKAALTSALQEQNQAIISELQISNRLKIRELFNQGISMNEIHAAIHLSGNDFGKTLVSPADRAKRDADIEAIRKYQTDVPNN